MVTMKATAGIELFGYRGKKEVKFVQLYPRLICAIFETALRHHYRQCPEFGKPFDRGSEQKKLMNLMGFSGIELEALSAIEDQIFASVHKAIKNDGHDYYGVYLVEYVNGNRNFFTANFAGDYRIIEWEAGRGKPQDESYERDEIETAVSSEEGTWGSPDTTHMKRQTVRDVTLQCFVRETAERDIQSEIARIKKRIEDGEDITDTEMQTLQDYDPDYMLMDIREQEWKEERRKQLVSTLINLFSKRAEGITLTKSEQSIIDSAERQFPGIIIQATAPLS